MRKESYDLLANLPDVIIVLDGASNPQEFRVSVVRVVLGVDELNLVVGAIGALNHNVESLKSHFLLLDLENLDLFAGVVMSSGVFLLVLD